jgi:uncharacterized membrane protein YeaQ/YmgE (transglycosylase-associated protein family)
MTPEQLPLAAIVGLVAAFLASRLVTEHGYGVVGDIVVGVSGALIGASVLRAFITGGVLAPLGIAGGSPVAQIIVALIGAVVPLTGEAVSSIRVFDGHALINTVGGTTQIIGSGPWNNTPSGSGSASKFKLLTTGWFEF